MYDITDLLKKTIAIASKKKRLFEGILENTPDPRLRILIQVMINRVNQDVLFYENLMISIKEETLEPIDFGIYDMISSLVNQFGRSLTVPVIKTRKEMVSFCIDLEKAIYALMLDVQGRLAQAEGRTDGITYRTIGLAIEQKKHTISEWEKYNPE